MSAEFKGNDLRRYAIKNRTAITCRVRSADQVCVVNEKGLLKIPGISGRPPYNVEDVLARADEFTLTGPDKRARPVSRAELAALLNPPKPAEVAPGKK